MKLISIIFVSYLMVLGTAFATAMEHLCPDTEVEVVSGKRDGGGHFVTVSACLTTDLAQVWEATKQDAYMKWSATKLESVNRLNSNEETFETKYSKKRSFVTARWTMNWTHTSGDLSEQEFVQINYKKVSGTNYIKFWEGTIKLTKNELGQTMVVIRNEFYGSPLTGVNQADVEKAGKGLFDRLVP